MERLFGTDGIRGEVGKFPLTQEAVFAVGRTLGVWLKEQYPQQKSPLKILIGRDTRESGDDLEVALSGGAKFAGLQVLCAGVCPTPTVAYLTCTLGAHLGIAVSASHNPCSDNGIKLFDADGYKLLSFAERRIEEIFFGIFADKIRLNSKLDPSLDPSLKRNRKVYPLGLDDSRAEQDFIPLYLDFVKNILGGLRLSGLTVVVDCAFGSFSKIAPQALRELGADVVAINSEPDGKNINVNCGTLYPQAMAEELLRHRADIGIAFDGDGDRVIVADEKGNILDGDHILAVLSRHFLEQNRLTGNSVICTQMSNIGLELYLQNQGIRMVRTEVGDKYVLEEMLKTKANLGGEQSGHIIILERTTTGDGLIAALELIQVMLKTKKRLSELSGDLRKFPQTLVNVRVKEKRPLEEIPGLNDTIKRCQKELGEACRILVRYSGTEKLARIMVEGRCLPEVSRVADSLAMLIQNAVGENK
ncbi:MAG: phosphoglucosamine mutase [Candidatus Omnitrophica bacterium]|nr:phosphoglucosamine mutase [Candidatus Omnitrophota bacterium]